MSDLDQLTRLVASGRVPPPEVLAARTQRHGVLYFVESWVVTSRSWAVSMLVIMVLEPLAYLLALGWGLGALVDRNEGATAGVPYLTFVGPALLVATTAMASSQELSYPVLAGFRWRRLYFGPAATPMTPSQICLGHLGGATVRFVAQAALFWLALLAFGVGHNATSWVSIPVAVLTTLALAAPIQAYAAGLENETSQFAFIQRFVIMPMFLFAGTFFPLSAVPGYLQWIGWLTPVWHGVELSRWVTYGTPMTSSMALVHVGYLAAVTVAGVVVGMRRYERRLRS